MNIDFSSKVVIVTGAAAGIGLAITEDFLANGACVLLVDYDEALLGKTKSELVKIYPNQVAICTADLRKASVVGKNIVQAAVDAFGAADILINNAGIYPSKYSLDVTEDDWDRVFDLNVKGYFFMAQAAASYWVTNKKKGVIINISSGASITARPAAIPYCTSKAAVKMLTHGLALEWIRQGIRVNAVGPGLIETDALLKSLTTEVAKAEHKEKISMIPIARTGLPSEIADAVLFMASDRAEFVVGQNFLVDGGYTAGRVFKSKM